MLIQAQYKQQHNFVYHAQTVNHKLSILRIKLLKKVMVTLKKIKIIGVICNAKNAILVDS